MKEHLGYIDFIKGIAIVSVILLHSLSHEALIQSYALFHIWQAVPVFVAVTFYLSFISLDKMAVEGGGILKLYFSKNRLIRLFKKILLPWMIVIIVQLLLILIFQVVSSSEGYLIKFFNNGGIGPGSYYCHIYMQLWVLMPFIYMVLSIKKNPVVGIMILSSICLLINIICNMLGVSPESWRLLFSRYLFLACISYIWLRYDTNWLVLSSLSLISIFYWFFADNSFGVLTYSQSWSTQNWPAYFYTLLYLKLLEKLYKYMAKSKVADILCSLGKDSWYIFLLQMFVLWIANYGIFSKMANIVGLQNIIILRLLYVIFALCVTIVPIYVYRFYFKRKQIVR